MKTKGIMMAALLLSGAAFAQNTPVKATGSTNIGQAIEADKSGMKANTDASAAARANVNTHAVKKMKGKADAKAQAAADHAVAAKDAVTDKIKHTAAITKEHTAQAVQANANTGAKVQTKHLLADQHTTTGTSAKIKRPAMKGKVHHSSAIHTNTVPVKVKTRITGGAGLKIW